MYNSGVATTWTSICRFDNKNSLYFKAPQVGRYHLTISRLDNYEVSANIAYSYSD